MEDVEYIFRQLAHEEQLHLLQYGAMQPMEPQSQSAVSTACDSPGDDEAEAAGSKKSGGTLLRASMQFETPVPNLGEETISIRRSSTGPSPATAKATQQGGKGKQTQKENVSVTEQLFGFELSTNKLGDNLISYIVPGSF